MTVALAVATTGSTNPLKGAWIDRPVGTVSLANVLAEQPEPVTERAHVEVGARGEHLDGTARGDEGLGSATPAPGWP